jgi:hypothetical protein
MRWQEEVTLTGYEMQWTVRYFLYMSQKWAYTSDDGISNTTGTGTTEENLSIGAIAYWSRKHAVWQHIMKKADSIFRRCNPAYDSPL